MNKLDFGTALREAVYARAKLSSSRPWTQHGFGTHDMVLHIPDGLACGRCSQPYDVWHVLCSLKGLGHAACPIQMVPHKEK